ncbi:hypothetical protein GCM10009716_07070 [Streptomyces sodiiphilus]|uniref:Hydrogenase expression protein HypF n=1 Tax=Streptomyces sodiiphilus TaxID=226217 RepID=A0ABN3HWW9_9ACTN
MPSDGPAGREGARHAAERKSLLKRLNRPVGRAASLAVMPSAMLLGMGVGSPLAKAEQQPENPFRDGPCVEMPDVTEEERDAAAEQESAQDAAVEEAAEEAAAESGREDGAADGGGTPERTAPSPSPEAGTGGDTQGETTEPREPAGDGTEQEPEAAAEPERNPLDPLGLGPRLEQFGQDVTDFFTGGRKKSEPGEETPAAEVPAEEPAATPGPAPSAGQQEAGTPETVPAGGSPTGEPAPAPSSPAGEEAAGEDTQPETDEAEEADPFAPDADGKVPFPCPETMEVPGEDEATPVVLPDEAWFLDAKYLTLRGLKYHGVVNVSTANGSVKQVLKFTADRLDIGNLHQIVNGEDGLRYHVQAADGSNSTFRNGKVTMYTEKLEGKLFGLIPIVFDPEHQPPLDIPIAHFTDVFVTQAGQFGGELTIPGMRQYMTHG